MKVWNEIKTQQNQLLNPIMNDNPQNKNNNSQQLGTNSSDQNNNTPINIIFKNISYSVEIQKKEDDGSGSFKKQKQQKQILNNVSGIFKAGEVSAILGASGAGKTTLLNIIACRVSHKSAGKLYANKTEYNYDTFGDFANYVMQNDILMQTLTVRQTLRFATDLKLNTSEEEKVKKIDRLAKNMKLENCLDVKVGGQLIKGISGGEKKRTSIAFELISEPQVIILDQPTSGLDSLTSFIIVDYLSKLAHQRGKTVLMTIHQPNTEIYNKFDRLFLMIEGKFVYQGAASQAIFYFEKHFGLKCRQYQNPAQFQIQIMHHQDKKNVDRYPLYYKQYDQQQVPKVLAQIEQVDESGYIKRQNKVALTDSFRTLLKRDFTNVIRNPMLLQSRIVQSFILGLLVGGVYFSIGSKNYREQQYWYSIIGFYFFYTIGALMETLSPVSLVFPNQRLVFLKEENSRLYTVLPYFLSRTVIDLPYFILLPFILTTILYFMMDLCKTAQQYFLFYFITFLVNLCGNSVGLLIGSIIQDVKSVSAVVPIILLPLILFSGLFKNTGNLPAWLGWIQYISPLKYGFSAMVINQTNCKPSNIADLNFDVSLWGGIGLLIGLSVGYSALSLLFLWLLRTKIE